MRDISKATGLSGRGWVKGAAVMRRPPGTLRRRGLKARLAASTVVLLSMPFLIVGLTAGRAAASGAGNLKMYAGVSGPDGITAGPDGALWFTNGGSNSIGRITAAGKITNYTGADIYDPVGLTAGPDGALWFTNGLNNSIGRITTAGKVTTYPASGIYGSEAIVVGPDGALWFTSWPQQLDRADHHHGSGHAIYRHRHRLPRWDRGGA